MTSKYASFMSTTEAAATELPCAGVANDERIVLMGLLMESNARLRRVLSAELEQAVGIPLTWFEVMIRIRRSPAGHLTMSELAGQMVITSGGITRLIDRLEQAGYVERQNCPTDRRTTYLVLTIAGLDLMERATTAHLEHLDAHLTSVLEPDERAALAVTLAKLAGDSICGS
jgi:MarR family transcriptional regulator, 2-MHQ and catechol-resistance regulon repressor